MYGTSINEKILSGSKTTTRSAKNAAQYFLQGIEVQEIGLFRSGLPILGRNPRYETYDVTLTSSISSKPYYTDVEPSAAGIGISTFKQIQGTLYNRPGWVLNGIINTNPDSHIQIRNVVNNFKNRGFTGLALSSSVEGYIRTVLNSVSSEWDLGKGYISGSLFDEVYYVKGTYVEKTQADVKFPDGKIKQAISYGIGSEDYGYGKEYIDSTPYTDLTKYDAFEYVHTNGQAGMFPIVGSYMSYDEKLSYNGIVEPFEIRRRALGLSLFLEDEGQPGSVSGDSGQKTNINSFSYDSRENDMTAEFFEDVSTKGFAKYGSPLDQAQALLEAEFVSDYNKSQYPFKERDNNDLLISDSGIKSIQLSMDPTLDEGTLPVTHVDMTVGFDAESRDRVNSIVYRGMTRR